MYEKDRLYHDWACNTGPCGPEKTTFGELLETKLDSSHAIQELSISSYPEEKSTTLTNRLDIENLIQSSADQDLEKTDDPPKFQYVIRMKTEEGADITLAVGNQRLDIGLSYSSEDSSEETSGFYEIQGENSLLRAIEDTDLEWEHR